MSVSTRNNDFSRGRLNVRVEGGRGLNVRDIKCKSVDCTYNLSKRFSANFSLYHTYEQWHNFFGKFSSQRIYFDC